jgi:hypothetical protein
MVPLAGVEPARLAALDFESSASTNSATGALVARGRFGRRADIIEAQGGVNPKARIKLLTAPSYIGNGVVFAAPVSRPHEKAL